MNHLLKPLKVPVETCTCTAEEAKNNLVAGPSDSRDLMRHLAPCNSCGH